MLSKTAFIIVDVQNDFITGTLSLSNCPSKDCGEEVVPVINEMIENYGKDFAKVVYTKDWHPQDHISFYENRENWGGNSEMAMFSTQTLTRENKFFKEYEQILWPAHCIRDTWGAMLHEDLTIVPESLIVNKGIHSDSEAYSGFFDNKKEFKTELDESLKKDGVTDLVICGLATDVCVDFTVKDAVSLGYKVEVVLEACRGVDEEQIQKVIENWKKIGVNIVDKNLQ